MLKKFSRTPAVQQVAGNAIAGYLRLVDITGRYVIDPPDMYDMMMAQAPFIFAMWHGEHYMTPFVKHTWRRTYHPDNSVPYSDYPVDALISRHRDGEINAIAANALGIGTIRGSGAHGTGIQRKGGGPAFREMMNRLREGRIVALTADVPKVSRVAGPGIVRLAAHSGRPIFPVAIVTSRRHHMDTWDKSVINLPFSRIVISARPAIWVERDSDDAALEAKRVQVQDELNAVTERAYALADKSA